MYFDFENLYKFIYNLFNIETTFYSLYSFKGLSQISKNVEFDHHCNKLIKNNQGNNVCLNNVTIFLQQS